MSSGKQSDLLEFHRWLTANKKHLDTLTINEIAERAILVGFDPYLVHQWKHSERFRRMERTT